MRNNIWRYVCSGGFGQKDRLAYKHPATFPQKLAEDHILTWSNVGDLVFDPFAGSGTTLLMASKHNRHYIGCEISKEYCDLIDERFKKFMNSNYTNDNSPSEKICPCCSGEGHIFSNKPNDQSLNEGSKLALETWNFDDPW